MDAKFTPGPWHSDEHFSCHSIIKAGEQPIAQTECKRTGPVYEDRANARLIAAAPDLLAACQALVELLDSGFLVRNTEHDHEPDWAIKQLEPIMKLALLPKAIAKAEGGQ